MFALPSSHGSGFHSTHHHSLTSNTRLRHICLAFLCLAACGTVSAAEKPAILFCTPESTCWLDLDYAKELRDKGFEVDYTSNLKEVTWDRLKHYNVVLIYATPYGYERLCGNEKALRDPNKPFLAAVEKYVSAGGGVFLMPYDTYFAVQVLDDLLPPLGAKLPMEMIEETNRANLGTLVHINGGLPLALTDQVLPSPVSQGVKQVWYSINPAYNAQQTNPIMVDENWTVVVKGSKTSCTRPTDLSKTNLSAPPNVFSRPGGVKEPDLFAIREYKGGRIALIDQWRQFSIGSGTKYVFDRQVLSKGCGGKPSDFGKLLENTFRWLAEPSLKAGNLGGHVTQPEKLLPPNASAKVKAQYADIVWPYDAAKLNTVALPTDRKIFRGLLGVKTSYSTGKGSVAEFAAAASAVGLDFVIFMDDFAKLTRESFHQLKADCKKYSTAKLKLLPGFCIDTNIGNHAFVFGDDPIWVCDECLTGPNKSILYVQQVDPKNPNKFTGYMTAFSNWVLTAYHGQMGQLGYYNFAGSPQGMRMWDLRSCAAAAVRYYKDGKLVEDKTDDYLVGVHSTLPPVPLCVSEVKTPEELKREVESGHALIYADARSPATVFTDALHWTSQYDSPTVSVSDGPRVVAWAGGCAYRVNTLGAENFVVGRSVMPSPLLVTSETGLKEVRLYNGRDLYRRFLLHGAKNSAKRWCSTRTSRRTSGWWRKMSRARRSWRSHAVAGRTGRWRSRSAPTT